MPSSVVSAIASSAVSVPERLWGVIAQEIRIKPYRERDRGLATAEGDGPAIPAGFDYVNTPLRTEARERLIAGRPATVGAASRLVGITAADVATLRMLLRR